MKEGKDIIEEIVDRLKASDDYGYKEGAWEKYQSYDKSSSFRFKHIQKYVAVAAAVMLVALLSIHYYNTYNNERLNIGVSVESLVEIPQKVVDPIKEQSVKSIIANDFKDNKSENKAYIKTHEINSEKLVSLESGTLDALSYSPTLDIELPDYVNHQKMITLNKIQLEKQNVIQNSQNLKDHLVATNTSLSKRILTHDKLENAIGPKFFQFANRFELGLFISPFTNSDNLKVGAGLSLSYRINKKISLRTGASFNNYEVGILKNPLDDNSVEQVLVAVDNSALNSPESSSLTMQTSRVTLPNINAVTGFVQSLEVPLELQYKLNNSFYAVAGLSYSTIINQERNAHYLENANSLMINDKESLQDIKPVSKTIKSATENVNPNTFSGFVNLSVGKKVNVNHKFGVSVEPYYKIPLGGFRKADMNYSNAGIRIITNF